MKETTEKPNAHQLVNAIRLQAMRDFAKRLKENTHVVCNRFHEPEEAVTDYDIDDILAEMEEELV
jgi:hypothetical protein